MSGRKTGLDVNALQKHVVLDSKELAMKKAARPRLAIAAIFPAAIIPITLPAMQVGAISDVVRGVVVGVLLGTSLLLLILARKLRSS